MAKIGTECCAIERTGRCLFPGIALPVAFLASPFGFPLIISLNYLYVCNYLFFNYMSVRVFHPRNWRVVRVFHPNHSVRSEGVSPMKTIWIHRHLWIKIS